MTILATNVTILATNVTILARMPREFPAEALKLPGRWVAMPDGAMEELRAPASWDDAEERAEEDASPNAEGVSCMH